MCSNAADDIAHLLFMLLAHDSYALIFAMKRCVELISHSAGSAGAPIHISHTALQIVSTSCFHPAKRFISPDALVDARTRKSDSSAADRLPSCSAIADFLLVQDGFDCRTN